MNLKKMGIKITATFAAMLMMFGNFGLLGVGLKNVIAEELEKSEEDKKEIVAFDEESKVDIYKGYLYSNVKNDTNYETEYNTVSNLNITDKDSMDNIKLAFENSEFIKMENDKEEAISSKENIYFKSTQISKFDFDTILGVDGYIEIQSGEEIIATVKYNDAKKDRKLQITYLSGEVKEVEEEILVEYANKINNIIIKTSKPQAEGTIKIINNKAIKATKDFDIKELESFKALKENLTVETTKMQVIEEQEVTNIVDNYSTSKKVELKEPKTQIDLSVNNTNLSTLTQNDIVLTATLRTDDAKYKLFKNPVIEIKLPEGVKKVSAQNIRLLYGQNTIKIEKAEIVDNKIIRIELSGEQNQYNVGALQEGASIVLPLSLTFDMTTPMQDTKIKLSVNNNKELSVSEADVKLISKTGLMSVTTLYKNENNVLTVIDNQKQELMLEVGQKSEDMTMQSVLINNTEKALENVVVIGKVSESKEIPLTLKDSIKASKNVEIYYSENSKANETDSSWVKDVKDYSKVKSYMIKISKMEPKEKVTFKYDFNVASNLEYNKSTNMKYDVYYNQEEKEMVEITLKTEEVPSVDAEVVPNTSLDYVYVGQIVEYTIKVTNNSENEINNLIIEDCLPEGTVYTEYKSTGESVMGDSYSYVYDENVKTKTWEIEKIAPNEKIEKKVLVKVKDIKADSAQITNTVNAKIKLKSTNKVVTIGTASSTKDVKKAVLEIDYNTEFNSNAIYAIGDVITYYAKVKNTTNSKLKDIKIFDNLPNELEYQDGYVLKTDSIDNYEEQKGKEAKYDSDKKQVTWNVGDIEAGETKIVVLKAKIANIEKVDTVIPNKMIVNIDKSVDVESDNINIYVKKADFNIEISTDSKTNIKEGETISYKIKVTNLTDKATGVNLKDVLPSELKLVQIKYYDKAKSVTYTESDVYDNVLSMDANETKMVELICLVKDLPEGATNKEIQNQATIYFEDTSKTSNIIKTVIEKVEQTGDKEDNITDGGDSNTGDNGNNENNGDNNNPLPMTYTIRGTAWLDSNKNGQREQNETLLSNVKVMLIDANTNKLVTNEDGSIYSVTTGEDGTYVIEDLSKGNYILIFEYDTNKYTVTVYRKDGIDENINSDAINKSIAISGEQKLVALTDTILIEDSGKSNIDIGLIENATFDLSLDKQISSITVTNAQGTKKVEYKNQNFAKIDLVAKYMNNTNVIITYKFIIKNEGDVTGYVDELVDNLPSGLEFSSELNKDWYKGSDGNLYTTALDGIGIKPGEASEVELILTKKTTENTTGTFSNNAELTQISNIEAIEEKETAKENNKSSADVVISIKTGSAMMYLGITILSITIIGAGAYIIKKKVINKGI